jgi:hypothetical protein
MKQKFADLLFFFKKGVKSRILFAFEFAFLVMEFYISSNMPVIIEYDDGREKKIKDLKDLVELKKEVFREALKDLEVVEILQNVAEEED